ncbi:hypothetical protein [Shimazuella kribbensis]|uniref:hypothetical protein n=1 Tax=Shimazuella kribbensis TaxID=139808 RepID=UPI00041BB8B3|nr:hypothetical protein [Shimazuella kribbensis]
MQKIIRKNRDEKGFSKEELTFLIHGYNRGDIPDYQMSAWAMAVYFQGMSSEVKSYTINKKRLLKK